MGVMRGAECGRTVEQDTHPDTDAPPPPTDAILVQAARAGDVDAFAQLVHRYRRSVCAVAVAILRDAHLADDVAQEAFLSAYRSLNRLADPSAFGGWIITIARNGARKSSRRRRPMPPLQAGLLDRQALHPPPPPEPPDPQLLGAIAALPEQERGVLMLRYFEQHDVAAIAAILGRSVGTVTKQLSRAHNRLRRLLAGKDRP